MSNKPHEPIAHAAEGPAADVIKWRQTIRERDRFTAACAALQSVSCGVIAQADHGTTPEALAATAVAMADALLAALNPESGSETK